MPKYSNTNNDIVLIDEASATETYIGYSISGAATNVAQWKIKKLTIVGILTSIEFADGVAEYSKIWDDRASYTYS